MNPVSLPVVDRRTTLKWLASTMVAVATARAQVPGGGADTETGFPALGTPGPVTGPRYGSDPDLLNPAVPWERTMTPWQMRVAAALCDMIMPADDISPSATAVGVHEFVDEWVSAPYPGQQRDRELIFDGLEWLERTALDGFGAGFADLSVDERAAILDTIAYADRVGTGLEDKVAFFHQYRNLTMSAFYATEEGSADLGYIGNVPIAGEYPGPTPEALAHLEQALTNLGLPITPVEDLGAESTAARSGA